MNVTHKEETTEILFNSISSWKPHMTFKIKRKPNKSQTWWTSNLNASDGSAADISMKTGLVRATNEYMPTLLLQLIVTKVSFAPFFSLSSCFFSSVRFCSVSTQIVHLFWWNWFVNSNHLVSSLSFYFAQNRRSYASTCGSVFFVMVRFFGIVYDAKWHQHSHSVNGEINKKWNKSS